MSSVNPRRSPTMATTTLRKGATFHTPASFEIPPSLPRAHTTLDDAVDANRRRIALTLSEVEEVFEKTAALSLSPTKTEKHGGFRDNSLPIPRGFLDLPATDAGLTKEEMRRTLRPRSVRRSRQHASDSGLGSSVASANDDSNSKRSTSDNEKNAMQLSATAITRSAAMAPPPQALPVLSRKAIGRIHGHTLRPLMEKPSLKEFQPIVLDVPRKIRAQEIICLRDLEKTLFFMAPQKGKTAALYLDFCLTSIRCIQATVEYLSDREQTRPGDRPYTNGYFIDLKEQIYNYGRQLASLKEDGITAAANLDFDQSDQIKLYGGVAENGRPAELVRIRKDGTAISMATGEIVDLDEGPVHIKRSASEQREDEEEIMRSMARRKKNATPEELAPKKCREPGCKKEFKRPCDLTKHEKTHSRPWKCPLPTCKYHEFGWPTEKEMDRHVNDKHSDAPAMYECLFKPCPYKSKRESNCKQHMEKAHGWHYVRTKTNGKKDSFSNPSSIQQTPPLGNVSTPSTDLSYGVATPPLEQSNYVASDFPLYPNEQDWMAANGLQTEDMDTSDLILENPSPSSAASYEAFAPYQNGSTFIMNDDDIYAANVQLPEHLSEAAALHIYSQQPPKMMPQAFLQSFHTPSPVNTAAQQLQHEPQVQLPLATSAAHFSPSAEHNAMLYTPDSLQGVDAKQEPDTGDFQLFPHYVNKATGSQSLFKEVPSADLGFSQTSQQDIFNQIDWSNFPYHGFPE